MTAISEVRNGSSTDTTIIGGFEEVVAEIKKLFASYHPYGYGTMVQSIRHAGSDNYEARVTRANSCD